MIPNPASWAEPVAEALVASPDQLDTILDDARAGAPWRRQLGVAEPSAALVSALDDLARLVELGYRTVEAVLAEMDDRAGGGGAAAVLAERHRRRKVISPMMNA